MAAAASQEKLWEQNVESIKASFAPSGAPISEEEAFHEDGYESIFNRLEIKHRLQQVSVIDDIGQHDPNTAEGRCAAGAQQISEKGHLARETLPAFSIVFTNPSAEELATFRIYVIQNMRVIIDPHTAQQLGTLDDAKFVFSAKRLLHVILRLKISPDDPLHFQALVPYKCFYCSAQLPSQHLACSQCRKTHYCSRECVAAHWSKGGHGTVCAQLH